MGLPEGIILLDSLGDLQLGNSNPVLVCGSHCGGNRELAMHVRACGVKAVFLNNAGIGKNNAGIRGLKHYQAENVLACAVDRNSAEIGISKDTWEHGVISHINTLAGTAEIQIGDTVKEAVAKISNILQEESIPQNNDVELCSSNKKEGSEVALKKQTQLQVDGVDVTVTDSITFLNESNAGHIVVCGSHGGLSAGHYAQKHNVKAVFFNDAGIGKNNAGVKSLELLSDAGILACTVDCMSAEIFNGHDVLENGVISVCNQLAKDRNIVESMMVKEAVRLI